MLQWIKEYTTPPKITPPRKIFQRKQKYIIPCQDLEVKVYVYKINNITSDISAAQT